MRYSNDNNTESGVYYIVPDRNGKPGSKRIVRRPRAPLTSVPLDDDFDAITRTTMYTGKGRYSWVPTQPPLDDEFDAVTYTNTNTNFEKIDEVDEELEEVEGTVGGRDTVTRMRREEEEEEANENTRCVEHGDSNRQRPDIFHRYRRASTSRVDDYGYHRQRSDSRAEQRSPPSPNTKNARYNSQSRPSDDFASRYIPSPERTPRSGYTNGNTEPPQPVRNASRRSSNRNRSNSLLQPHDPAQNGRGAIYRSEEIIRHHGTNGASDHQRAPSVRRRRRDSGVNGRSRSRSRSRTRMTRPNRKAISTTTPHLHPPARQQSYEVVKSRVLKDTPEKTVTISTWRERVARANGARRGGGERGGEKGGDREEEEEEETRMSVYYIDADDYPVEDRNGRVVELEQRVYEGENGGPVEWMGSKSPRIVKRTMSNGGSGKGKGKERFLESVQCDKQAQSSKTDFRDRVLTPWPSMSELGDIDEKLQEDEDDDQGCKQLIHRRSRSLPADLDWRDPDEPDPTYDRTHPRTSTPIRDLPYSSQPNPPKSTSLLPTRSNGSTISSVRGRLSRPSTSTQPSSIHPPPNEPRLMTEILTSCKPSLAHLEPMLHELGIRSEDHLKAVGKMSEITRDREIKRIAVEKGVTVLEWAMLIDKIQNL